MKTEVVLYKHSVTFNVNDNDYVTVTDHEKKLSPNDLLNMALEVAVKAYGLSDFNITQLPT